MGEAAYMERHRTEELIVGDKLCSFVDVRDVMISCDSVGSLYEKLLDVARSLHVQPGDFVSLKNKLSMNTVTRSEALYEILQAWRAAQGRDASLPVLTRILETIGLKGCADALRKRFGPRGFTASDIKLTNSTTWNDLLEMEKMLILAQPVLFQDKQINLEELFYSGQFSVDQKLLAKIVNGEVPCVVRKQVPGQLEYYIARHIRSRQRLKPEVLRSKCNDIFVIEGMEKYQLSSLVPETETTEVSGNQCSDLTHRFIHLEHSEDYKKICKLSTVPVHWLKDNNGVLEFIESSGPIKNLQRFVAKSQKNYNEKDFLMQTGKVTIIADSPGMGKTILLANIANTIIQVNPGTLVFFIVLKEFVQSFKNQTINADTVIKAISEQLSEFVFGKEYVTHILKAAPSVLMFDGLDEVLSSQMSTAINILQETAVLKFVQLFVSTRPHMKEQLENSLYSFGYTIEPFDTTNQITFLTNFWSTNGGELNDSLLQFTESCLNILNSRMTISEREIAGIPLQCKMLAETYEEQAVRCSLIGYDKYENSNIMVQIRSVFEIYGRHINMRFEKICKNDSYIDRMICKVFNWRSQYDAVKYAHMFYAMELLFPSYTKKFQILIDSGSACPLKTLCGFGILEATNSYDVRFVHRTFAEYLIAWFAVLETPACGEAADFILSELLATKPQTWKLEHALGCQEVYASNFKFPAICYFINGFAKKQHVTNCQSNGGISVANLQPSELLSSILSASAYHNLEYIPHLMTCYFGDLKAQENNCLISHELLLTAANFAGVEMTRMYTPIVNLQLSNSNETNFFNSVKILPLHVAVHRGHYPLIEYLVQKYGSELYHIRYLLHFCVYLSNGNSKSVILDKIQIIKLLMTKSRHWLEEKVMNNLTPLLQSGVDVELLDYLIQTGADTGAISADGNTPLHVIVKNDEICPNLYHRIVKALSDKKFVKFNWYNKYRLTPLHSAVERFELLEDTMALFSSKGTDFNAINKYGDSILFSAIRRGRSLRIILSLIKFGANVKHHNRDGKTILHLCALHGNIEALEFVLNNYKLDINAQDVDWNTPLHTAIVRATIKQQLIVRLLLEKGADVNIINGNNKTAFIMMLQGRPNLGLIVLFEKHGLKINKQVADAALKSMVLTHRLLNYRDSHEEHLSILDYLIQKGGQVDFQFTKNVWNWNNVTNCMHSLIKMTEITSKFLKDAQSRGLLEDNEMVEINLLSESLKSQRFYAMVKDKPGSFERVYATLLCDKQFAGVGCLDRCLKNSSAILCSSIFVTPPIGLSEFILDDTSHLLIIISQNVELSHKRIQDTIYQKLNVVDEHSLSIIEPSVETVLLLKSILVTRHMLQKLTQFKKKIICICRHIEDNNVSAKVIKDTFSWVDISTYFVDKMKIQFNGSIHNVTTLFTTPMVMAAMGMSVLEKIMENKTCKIVEVLAEQDFPEYNRDNVYLSNTLFHFFLPDLLVFTNITEEGLKQYAIYGQKLAKFGQNITNVDYIVLQENEQFDEICRELRPERNAHLIRHHQGCFMLIQTKGLDKSIKKFIQDKQLSGEQPAHSFLPASNNELLSISYIIDKQKHRATINCREFLKPPVAVEFRQIKSLLCHLHCDMNLEEVEEQFKSNCNSQQITQLVKNTMMLVTELKDYECLINVALCQAFPGVVKPMDPKILGKYVTTAVLNQEESVIKFVHNSMAGFFISEFLLQIKHFDIKNFKQVFNDIVCKSFETTHEKLEFSIPNGHGGFYFSTLIHSFRFIGNGYRIFEFLEASLNQENNGFSKHLKAAMNKGLSFKWIHACVNGNFYGLLKAFNDYGLYNKNFESQNLVVLATKNSGIQIIDLVAQNYSNETGRGIQDIRINLHHTLSGRSFPITILHFAVLRGELSVVEHLLNAYRFKEILSLPHMKNLVQFCVRYTQLHRDRLDERKRILEYLLQIQPDLLHWNPLPLLHPKIHIDLIIHLINLGADINATDSCSSNVLHLCPEYLTPKEYNGLIEYLHNKGFLKLLNSKPKQLSICFHRAVQHLEVLDSTFEMFFSENIDLTAENDSGDTILITAVKTDKSMRLLDLLIRFGADKLKRGRGGKTMLHFAAIYGNFTAVRYFLNVGTYVNATDDINDTALHDCLKLCDCKQTTHEIVQVLVEHGADVNVAGYKGRTPLFLAMERRKKKRLEACTVDLLRTELK